MGDYGMVVQACNPALRSTGGPIQEHPWPNSKCEDSLGYVNLNTI